MNALILYATKHGATKEIAQRIAKHMPGETICDLKNSGIPSISQFDCVVIGSSVYVGSIHKEAKAFLSQNADALRSKRLGLFLSGLNADEEKIFFESNFKPDILQAAAANSFLGGVFDPKKTGMMARLVMKAVAKQSGYTNTVSDDKIEQFAEALKR
jgi:menaquinone-dependent protoporphyrinogen oxidase